MKYTKKSILMPDNKKSNYIYTMYILHNMYSTITNKISHIQSKLPETKLLEI